MDPETINIYVGGVAVYTYIIRHISFTVTHLSRKRQEIITENVRAKEYADGRTEYITSTCTRRGKNIGMNRPRRVLARPRIFRNACKRRFRRVCVCVCLFRIISLHCNNNIINVI